MATNWATNITFHDAQTLHPRSEAELASILRAHPKVRVRGTGHCFNTIADSYETVVILDQMPDQIVIDAAHQRAKVPAGMNYSQISTYLESQGWALHNLASLPHISIAGAIATGTHGSGLGNGALHTAVRAVTMMRADGSIATLTQDHDEEFYAAVVALGANAIALSYEVAIEPSFQIFQTVYGDLPYSLFAPQAVEILGSAYSVSFFTHWDDSAIGDLWVKSKLPNPDLFHGIQARSEKVHPILGQDPASCTDQLGVAGPWHLRLPHFKIDATPSAGNEQQSEFFVAASDATAAFEAIHKIAPKFRDHLLVTEIRGIAADSHWLSPAYGRESVAFHFTWKNLPEIPKLAALIEAALAPFNYRPHFGKVFTASPSYLRSAIPHFGEFVEYIAVADPTSKFGNEFLSAALGVGVTAGH